MSPVLLAYFVLAAIAANMPFVVNRALFFMAPTPGRRKHWAWCMLELTILYGIVMLLGWWLESHQGPVHERHFLSFYVPTIALFLIAAYPGFVIRFFWRTPGV